jgi:DNA polymerase-4
MQGRVIMHIDVNSAFLSWQAVYNLQRGYPVDLREIPSAVGGNQETRHGIILAKSIPAKKFGVKTGEPVWEAKNKCPKLVLVPPDYHLYMKCSSALMEILRKYSPKVQQYSIDEAFLDYTGMEKRLGPPLNLAVRLKDRIREELGFTVNIGVSCNKLLAKMASELKKPDMVHSLFPEDIEHKMWPLPVEKLFMVGKKNARKLQSMGIFTIGDLAVADPELLKHKLKSHGLLVYNYAQGIEDSAVFPGYYMPMKGMGNSSTIPFDVEDTHTARLILLSLSETVSMRLRYSQSCCSVISVSIKYSDFRHRSHQQKLPTPINCTMDVYKTAARLFDEAWDGSPVRHIALRVTSLDRDDYIQCSLFDRPYRTKNLALDKTVDSIRNLHGTGSVVRACFINSGICASLGGAGSENWPVMSSTL